MLRVSEKRPVLTLGMLEKAYAWSDVRTVKLDVGRTMLPAGPAIRILRHWANGDTPSDVAVSVTYVIRPPEINKDEAFSATASWSSMTLMRC
jgi:hypothetical protein